MLEDCMREKMYGNEERLSSVNGKKYTEMEFLSYAQLHIEEFSRKSMEKLLEESLQKLSLEELAEREDFGVIETVDSYHALVIGNMLYMAIALSKHDMIAELLKKNVPFKDGRVMRIVRLKESYPRIEVNERGTLLSCILNGVDDTPEYVWKLLWERYIEQRKDIEKKKWIEWPNFYGKAEVLKWLYNLFKMQEKLPELYQTLVTEEFANQLLFLCAKEGENDEIKQKLNQLSLPLQQQSMMWEKISQNVNNVNLDQIMIYMKFWKEISGKKLVLDAQKMKDFNWFRPKKIRETLYMIVSSIKNAKEVFGKEVFSEIIQNQSEEELISALKIDLISHAMLEDAFQYTQKKQQRWAFPLLILKHHGEWRTEENDEI